MYGGADYRHPAGVAHQTRQPGVVPDSWGDITLANDAEAPFSTLLNRAYNLIQIVPTT